MPELPEVEIFRRLLLPLISNESAVSFATNCNGKPPKSFLSQNDLTALNRNCHVFNILRKGKQLCIVLDCMKKVRGQKRVYLFLHMGMTGRISTPSHVPQLESLSGSEYPPRYTWLTLKTTSAEASFSDPRKFGSVVLSVSLSQFDQISPDALSIDHNELRDGLVGKSLAIKTLLMDQRRVVSGVGNWVADEVLYQSHLHPNQTCLTELQATTLASKLIEILTRAVDCLDARSSFPEEWIFHQRWKKHTIKGGSSVKDYNGKKVLFITAGGRTSAIVPELQIKRAQKASDQHLVVSIPSRKRKRSTIATTKKGAQNPNLSEETRTKRRRRTQTLVGKHKSV